VEFCGLFGHDAGRIRDKLDMLGLQAVSNHVSLAMLADDFDSTAGICKALGCRFVVLGFLEEAHRHYGANFGKTLSAVRQAAEACREAGLKLAYHNHNFEFFHAEAGNGMELMLDAVPCIRAQFDTGWLGISGQDAVAMLRKYAGRYESVHLKDYLEGGADGNHDFCPVGMGVMDYKAITAEGTKGGAEWFIVDQDSDKRRSALEAARLSREYLMSLGY
jgi:sugar phosphate isomerase/epimerase